MIERIEALSIPEPMTGCWLWLGQTHASRSSEYGRIEVAGRRMRAHRVALACRLGRKVRCDRVVTQRQNAADQRRRVRLTKELAS